MTNYLQKVLFVEVVEKISRMQRFLHLESGSSDAKDTEVVKVFGKALDALVSSLRPVIERLSKPEALTEWEQLAIVRRLLAGFNSVERLHTQLQFIYGVWVRPETHVFIRNVLEFIPAQRRPQNVNVILSNMFSFWEADLSSYIEDVLYAADIFENENPSVFLPKIERDNPLNWAVLVHECGHVDTERIRRVLERPEITSAETDETTKEILHNWVEEIYCDLFATKILGPAYLASFATFALLVAGVEGAEIASGTHPPDIVRISIAHEILKSSKLRVALSGGTFEPDDLTTFFFNLLEDKTKLFRRYPSRFVEKPLPGVRLGDFVDAVCEEVDEIISLNQKLTVKDFDRISGLAERLSKGILIGSYPNPQLQEPAKAKFSNGRIDSKDLEEAKCAVQESRVLLWEIVNAGWVHKVEHIYPEAFRLFFGSENSSVEKTNIQKDTRPIKEKIMSWGEELERIDRLLLKSIEASQIQKLMEEE